MLKSVNSSATCPCVRRLAGTPGSRRRAAFLQTAPRFPNRTASNNVSPAQFNKVGMAELVRRRSQMPRMRSGGFLSSTVKETCPLPRDALRRPGPAHYHVELDKRKRLGEAATPANAALRAKSPRRKELPPDEAAFYCVSRAHDATRHARSFHLAAPEVAPFLQSAERFPPGPPFRAPAPNAYDPQKAYKKYFSGLLAGYTGTPTPVLYPDRSCDLNTVHPHCLLCPPLGLLTKQIGMPLHELYPCRRPGPGGFGFGGDAMGDRRRRRTSLPAQARAPSAAGPERPIKLGVRAHGTLYPTGADIGELSGRATEMGPGGFRSPGPAVDSSQPGSARGRSDGPQRPHPRPASRGRAAGPEVDADVADNAEQQVAAAGPAPSAAEGAAEGEPAKDNVQDDALVKAEEVPVSPTAARRSRSPSRASPDRASTRRQRSPDSAPVAVDGEEQGRRRSPLGSATLDPSAIQADAKDAPRFRLSLACPVEAPRDSTWTTAEADARFRPSLACPVEAPRDSTQTAVEAAEAADARFRLSLSCPVEAPRDSTLTAAQPAEGAFRLSLSCPVDAPRDRDSVLAGTGVVDEAVAVQGGDFRLSAARPDEDNTPDIQRGGAATAMEGPQQPALAADEGVPGAAGAAAAHPPAADEDHDQDGVGENEAADAAQSRPPGISGQGSPSCRSSGNLAAKAAAAGAATPGAAPGTPGSSGRRTSAQGAPQTRNAGAKTMSAPPSTTSFSRSQRERPQGMGGGGGGAVVAGAAAEAAAGAAGAEAWAVGLSGKASPACRSSASLVAGAGSKAAASTVEAGGRRLSTKKEAAAEDGEQ